MTTALAPTPLTAADRCDRCGAQAYLRVRLANGELFFCAHHGREYDSRLRQVALDIQDESDRLGDVPATATDHER